MSNKQHFIKFNFQCDTLKLEWFIDLKIPTFRTVDVVGLQIKDVDSIIHLNDSGQVVNLARSTGTDKQNQNGIRNSFLSQGIDVMSLPPVCLETGELIDGFTRQSALLSMNAPQYVYLVTRLKDGFTLEDAIDEMGLGLNLHAQSKSATIADFKKRLSNYICRFEASNGVKFTLNDGIEWFNGIPNIFSDEQIERAVDDALRGIRSRENMDSFSKKEAQQLGSKILNIDKDSIVAFNSSSSTYMDRGIVEAIKYFDDHGTVPTVVGFLSKVEAEDAEAARKVVVKEIKQMNNAFIRLMNEYKKDPDFNLINFAGFLPQVIDVETDIIKS
tara:strand:+ start:1252 stop:2238 length:987 start_codon:yes stop_codon:yes gene_type:complete